MIAQSTPKHVHEALNANVNPNSEILTDCPRAFKLVDGKSSKRREFDQHIIPSEQYNLQLQNYGFLKYFQIMFRTQYKGVSHHRLWLYLKEAEFRYSRRDRSHETFWDLVSDFPILTPQRKKELEDRNIFGRL